MTQCIPIISCKYLQVRKVEVFPVLVEDQLSVPLNMSCSKDAKVVQAQHLFHYLPDYLTGEGYCGTYMLAVHT